MPLIEALFLLTVAASAIFGKWWSPNDIKQFQKDLLQHAKNLDATVGACTKLDDGHRQSWQAFLQRLTTFATTNFGWVTTVTPDGTTHFGGGDKATADAAQALAKELYDWGLVLQAQGCVLTGPNENPTEGQGKTADQLVTALKYGAIIAGFVGGAYIAAQVASTIKLFKPAKS